MDDVHHAVSQGLAELRHTDSPLAAIGDKLHRFNTGEWTDDDFRVIKDRSEIDDRLAVNDNATWRTYDMGAAMLGGISGHAGLFSNSGDIAVLMQMHVVH